MTDPGQDTGNQTHFGFRSVPVGDKVRLVRGVFESVAGSYDLMNDLMSGGIHRLWKSAMIDWLSPRGAIRVLEVAGGTGDIARSEEHTSELQSLMRSSYAVFCLKKKTILDNNMKMLFKT